MNEQFNERELNYVLKTNEAVLMPSKTKSKLIYVKYAIWIIIGIIVFLSLFLGENIFAELSGSAKMWLIILAIASLGMGTKRENVPSPMELRFYDDYLVYYSPKRYYNSKTTRKIYNKIYYNTITECKYMVKEKRIHFYCDVEAKWYDYDENGNVPENPTYDRTVKATLIHFRTRCAPEVDFVKEIEEHSPIKVRIER